MSGEFVQTMTQFVIIATVVIVGIVLLTAGATGTSVGRAWLPQTVTDVVSKLLPHSFITDATATDYGEFQLDVGGAERLKKVNVHRSDGMTIAWAFDEALEHPQTGTFAFTGFRHNLKTDSPLVPEKVKARVDQALVDVLVAKQFHPANADSADIWINVFGALDDEVSLETLSNPFERPDNREWQEAIRTAMQHGGVGDATLVGRGSLILDVMDSRTSQILWRAAAIADIVVDVDETEKERRTGNAIAQMLRKFPSNIV